MPAPGGAPVFGRNSTSACAWFSLVETLRISNSTETSHSPILRGSKPVWNYAWIIRRMPVASTMALPPKSRFYLGKIFPQLLAAQFPFHSRDDPGGNAISDHVHRRTGHA